MKLSRIAEIAGTILALGIILSGFAVALITSIRATLTGRNAEPGSEKPEDNEPQAEAAEPEIESVIEQKGKF